MGTSQACRCTTETETRDRHEEHELTVDYDAPRRRDGDDSQDEPLAALGKPRSDAAQSAAVDTDDDSEDFVLPDDDLTAAEEFSVRVTPIQADEFTCTSCFLVHHRSQLEHRDGATLICADCA